MVAQTAANGNKNVAHSDSHCRCCCCCRCRLWNWSHVSVCSDTVTSCTDSAITLFKWAASKWCRNRPWCTEARTNAINYIFNRKSTAGSHLTHVLHTDATTPFRGALMSCFRFLTKPLRARTKKKKNMRNERCTEFSVSGLQSRYRTTKMIAATVA